MKKRTSILWEYDKLFWAANSSTSIKEALEKLNLRAAGGNYTVFKNACLFYKIHIPKNVQYDTSAARIKNTIPIEEVLVENSKFTNRGQIKKKCYELGLLVNSCSSCGLGTFWNGNPISLQLDHINGIFNDHRIENLRILCPNCHSQTDTFAGRKGLPKSSKIDRRTLRNDRPEKRKFEVDKKELSELTRIYSWVELGKKFNVSDNAVRKRAKKLGLI